MSIPKPRPARPGEAILASVRAMKEGEPPRVHNPVEGSAELAALRAQLGLSQTEFATRFGLSIESVRKWEQGRRAPDATARTLLAIIATDPAVVAELVRRAGFAA